MRGGGVVSRSTPAAPAPTVSERSISLQNPFILSEAGYAGPT